MHEDEGMTRVEEIGPGQARIKGSSFLIRSFYICRNRGSEGDMRGSIKLFTLSMDLHKEHRFELVRSEKIDCPITDEISAPFYQASGLNIQT